MQFISNAYLVSWSAAVRYHGPHPARLPNAVWVANHTSMIDYGLLCALTPFAVVSGHETALDGSVLHGSWS